MSNSTVSDLSQLAGLSGAKRVLRRLFSPSEGTHAVLLYGADGAGKRALAETLAQAWICAQPTDQGACGKCKGCESYARNRAADLLRIAPWGPSELIKLGAITYDPKEPEILPLREFVRTAPLVGRNKVVIMTRADRMNDSAANAFLKTLEEPHPYARFVLTTSEIGRVPPTIISRCLCIACELPPKADLENLVPGSPAELLLLSESAPGRLAHLSRHTDVYVKIAGFAEDLMIAPPAEAMSLSEDFREIAEELQDALGCNARAAYVEALRCLGAVLSDRSDREEWFFQIAEAHRRVLANVSAGTAFDAMFTAMLMDPVHRA